ncbi:MAG: hypothetical protein ACRDV9_15270 [Acidimicrobiia bacterium]
MIGQLLLGIAAVVSLVAALAAMAARPGSDLAAATSADLGGDPAAVARQACYRLLVDDVEGTFREMGEDEIALRHADQSPSGDWEASYQGCRQGVADWAEGLAP